MVEKSPGDSWSEEAIHGDLAQRLHGHRREIEEVVATRILMVSATADTEDPRYSESLKETIAAALDYCIRALDHPADWLLPPPPILLAQTRLAARRGVALDILLRRYLVGYTALSDFLVDRLVSDETLDPRALKRFHRVKSSLFDRLMTMLSEEYMRELEARLDSPDLRRADLVKRVLAGELVDPSDLSYRFDWYHIALVAKGNGIRDLPSEIARDASSMHLSVRPEQGTLWAWLGASRPFDAAVVAKDAAARLPTGAVLALGEPGEGVAGWRMSHRQAKAALLVASQGKQRFARYRDVALVSAALRDDLLASSLRELYLEPLRREGEGGKEALRTLRAYLAADRNVSSAASALGLARHTVSNRLRAIEEAIGARIGDVSAELEVASEIDRLDSVRGRLTPMSALGSASRMAKRRT